MAIPNMAADLREHMETTIGLSSVYIGALPSSPINAYAVIEYGGPANVKTHGSVPALDNGFFQIQARHKKTGTALANIIAVAEDMDGRMDTTINSTVYLLISELTRPRILVHEDESGNSIAVWECSVQARR